MHSRLLLLAAALSTTGCASYWGNRVRDLGDVFGFGILGGGFGASARATHFVQAGLHFDMNWERQVRFVGREARFEPVNASEVGIAPIAYFRGQFEPDDTVRAMVLGRTYVSNRDEEPERSFVPSRERCEKGYDRRLWDVGVSVHGIIGFDLEVNLLELGDFFLGWFGLDPLGDDEGAPLPEALGQGRFTGLLAGPPTPAPPAGSGVPELSSWTAPSRASSPAPAPSREARGGFPPP